MSPAQRYSFSVIRAEAQQLVQRGLISQQQPIYTLCQYIPGNRWIEVERELEEHDLLLRDRICELVTSQDWDNDDG